MIRLLVLLTESLILCCRAVADVGVGANVGPPGLHLLQVVLRAGVRAPVIALAASKRAVFGWGVQDSRSWDEVAASADKRATCAEQTLAAIKHALAATEKSLATW